MKKQKHILVAPLNWGLGHASRCIPIIQQLLNQDVFPIIASDGDSLKLLQEEFPQLISVELPSYHIRYPSQNMVWNMAQQLPTILKAIQLERKALKDIIKKHKIDAILSDNRYGIYSKDCPSILITHQLNILIPNKFADWWAKWMNKRILKRFDACWVPDFETEPNLSSILSHGHNFKNIQYIGPLSRMTPLVLDKKYDMVAVLSGPEPQRSFFEQKIVEQAALLNKKTLIVRGSSASNLPEYTKSDIEFIPYLTSQELNKKIMQSEILIARSGYSTIMDVVKMRCPKVIFVPTPGQTEQEYLAQQFSENRWFVTQKQDNFNLKNALESIEKTTGYPHELENTQNLLAGAIQDLLITCK
ncbi:MAG: glycosyltransferase [Aureispira sp.]|nr:glycosyltransferase [Aureispira sp.]